MLTLVKTKDAVALVNIYEILERDPGSKMHEKRQAAKKKQVGTVYFTHDMDAKNSNVSEAAGVLGMHKEHLKKQTHRSTSLPRLRRCSTTRRSRTCTTH